MIPHKLVIKNFLSYGETPTVIHFDAYHLICLSGKNGNGKSALLDAMTWAMWGQARKVSNVSKPDDGLLRLGQTRMLVTLEFSCNRQKYRVRREYIKSKSKAATSLDLEIQQEKGYFSSLTDKTIRATQEKINSVVGVDFETFINSSFIRQGQSNEFSKKSPKERKDVLASILGLDHYQKLQSAALEKIRSIQVEQQMLTRLNAHSQTEIEKKEELQSIYIKTTIEEKNIRENIGSYKNKLQTYEKKITSLEKSKIEDQHFTNQIEKEDRELKDGLTTIQTLVHSWKTIHHSSIHLKNSNEIKNEIEAKEQELTHHELTHKKHMELSTEEELLRNSLEKLNLAEQTRLNELTREKNAFEVEKTQQKTEHQHLTAEQKKIETCIKEILKKIETNKNIETTIRQATDEQRSFEEKFEKRKSFYHMFVQKLQFFDKSKDDLQEKKTRLEQQSSTNCPLCDQLVTAARKKFLYNTLVKQEKFLNHQRSRVTKILTQLKRMLLEQHPKLQSLIKNIQTCLQQKEELEFAKKELILKNQEHKVLMTTQAELLQLIETNEKKIKEIEGSTLKSNKELTANKLELSEVKKRILTLNYNQSSHSKTQQKLHALYQAINPEQVNRQEIDKKVLRSDIKHLISRLKNLQLSIKSVETEKSKLPPFEIEYRSVKVEKNEIEQKLEQTQKQLETLLIEQSKASNELQRIDILITQSQKQTKVIKTLQEEVNQYQTLAQAFSKNGIPALLIEEMVPEIESEANRLLQKLTNNQAQIFIESVRDLKKGGVKETLDIHISDSAGIRPYEMFSGGEAFRIDLALRISISKLLARRSGTALQTLIIDEGFGSQDEEGLQKIMDALYKIQNDFAKIIIVSHLPLMKDNFPVHFVIEKNALGSHIRIEERG
ncbi:SMC family ATPase [Candidatus Babeliales bacterium]|nr:SMC family ATPase [Candidatus Babeliales bacterium]